MGEEQKTFRSERWSPHDPPSGDTVDVIVRIYDPISDNLTNYGDTRLLVQNDRHLGRHYFQIN